MQHSHVFQRLDVLRKTRASPTEAGIQKTGTDTFIEPHSTGDFGDVCPQSLADIGNLIYK